ncbi:MULTISPECIES: class I SAM-dependent methyltransferase [Moorena]|uniref:Class I SAM-dependent methyltransferase n=2 Tax=Moorena producens TaxID=1155739 RepID=A0A1D9G1N5_MOOP1|nr:MULTISPECIES: class I SAM-dependent methyltransferase [Moorena]AOY81444.1 class I SAM-dependent methyltransferase [Moorena producens JHB]EGJ31559.1 methylase involved in ubiquinone/menaquinone biosynthesis [Moorena producens 3L]NEP67728.1 methyltransferase domain-containing protein [Moorena sp. SIO3A5]OLT66131.1 methyltransferase type 11 [Moorena producens 3L]
MTNQNIINNAEINLSSSTQDLLCCPCCLSSLESIKNQLRCTNYQCQKNYPVVQDKPILINESSSIFKIKNFLNPENADLNPKPKLERIAINLIPSIILNLKGKRNYKKFTELLLKQTDSPKVLIIGGSVIGQGMEELLSVPAIEIIESDVAYDSRIAVIFDSHNIPFKDNSFDGVIIQAVLEHVVDPSRCVEEIHRVLKKDGLVYSETPFMQQVHLGRYDFTRFTHLGHRRLFRKFEEICSGAVCGPGMALAWSYQYFLLSFVKTPMARSLIKVIARLTSFWLKYFDYYLIDKSGTFDSASGFYFMGKKSEKILDDTELITLYRGTQASSF